MKYERKYNYFHNALSQSIKMCKRTGTRIARITRMRTDQIAEGLRDENKAQLINYLKATNKEVGLLFNFGKKPDFKRAIFSNERKEISE